MTWQIPTKDKPRLSKVVRSFFSGHGWEVEDCRNDKRIELIAKKGQLVYLLNVVDVAQKEFFRYERMIEGMVHDSREIRALKQRTLVYILNFRFPSLPFETLVEQGASAFSLDEMHMVTGTARYHDELPPELGVREMALLEGNPKFCAELSERFHKAGDRASAIRWGEHSIKLRAGVSVNHVKLFRLYLEDGDLDGAERVGQEVFFFQPKNAEFLKLMEKLAIQRNDPEAAAKYRARQTVVEPADVVPRSFDALIRKQRTAAGLPAKPPPPAETKPEPRGIGRILSLLRGG